MKIELHPRFQKRLGKLSAADRKLVADSLSGLKDGFGLPHLHSGLGIRRLRKDIFECRAGLHWRVVFSAQKGLITVFDVMTHDQIKAMLREI